MRSQRSSRCQLKNINTSRVQCIREVGKSVLESVTVGERELVGFDAFSEEILVVLRRQSSTALLRQIR